MAERKSGNSSLQKICAEKGASVTEMNALPGWSLAIFHLVTDLAISCLILVLAGRKWTNNPQDNHRTTSTQNCSHEDGNEKTWKVT